MKKKFPLIGCYLLTFLLACIGIAFTCSCDRLGKTSPDDRYDAYDSTFVVKCINDYHSPAFTDVESVMDFQAGVVENEKIDSFIGTIAPSRLADIASVLIKRGERVTLRTLYKEYTCNRAIYDNLPISEDVKLTEELQPKQDATATEEQPRRVGEGSTSTVKSISYKDTMIDGKKHTIETKITQYE